MKSFKYVFLIIATGIIFQGKIKANGSVITFFIKEKKIIQNKPEHPNKKFVSQSLVQPSFVHAIGKDRSWLDQPGVNGIQASYLGYTALSDGNGQITFPREQQNDIIHLLITPQVEPDFMMSPSLIHHWITTKNRPAKFYKIERKKDKKLKIYYFDVATLEVPLDIPLNTITIYAHPDHIHVPVGISLNTYSTNFILPELEAHKVDTVKNSLYTLSIKQYFEQINIDNKQDKLSIATMVTNQ